MIGSNLLLSDDGYQISRSVRLRGNASGNFQRNLAGASTTTWTLSYWFKTGMYSSTQTVPSMFDQVETTGLGRQIGIRADSGCLSISKYAPTTYTCRKVTAQVFRDPSAWYHVVVVWNTTVATAEDRVQIYVNGTRVTSWSINTIPAQNETWVWTYFTNSMLGQQNRDGTAYVFFDGYLAEVNFIDGQALTSSSFGYTDSNGIWQPKAYTGTYGTNGFYLKFTDNSASTAATIGKDYSGNGNNWTPNNISVTAGVTYDSMIDSPTVSASASNYPVLNPLNSSIPATLAGANLSFSYGVVGWGQALSTFQLPTSGKWYCEFTTGPSGTGGGVDIGLTDYLNATYRVYRSSGNKASNSGGSVAYGSAFSSAGTVVGIAVDATNGTITFYNNNTSQGVAFTDINSAAPATGWYLVFQANNASTQYVNFGQRPFTYTPPSGFAALNTFNLPAATINNGATVMAASTYTGNGSTQSIANSASNAAAVSFKPDLVWTKARNVAYGHVLYDSVRGALKFLESDATNAEVNGGTGLTSFDANGFTTTAYNGTNATGTTYIGWQWQAGQGVTSTNTNGSITSTVSVNQSAGFSVATFTAPASGGFTVGHGLGIVPAMIIVKDRSAVVSWVVGHKALTNQSTYYLQLNSTSAAFSNTTVWNNTSPTSTVISFGVGGAMNASDNCVMYCWSEVAGYSKFGSYTGNGSADGPFVYCGFRPRFILIKDASSGVTNWIVHDTSRDTYNQVVNSLAPNSTAIESVYASSYGIDVTANGFKIRLAGSPINTTSDTHIFAAFAENPFNISRAR